ncbi:MAG TPA: nucleotidyltransferase domain-containing protein [Bacillota bacterium]|nr:nucleotidyltransferase domain-containing protein [Bacillota bacterium]
MLIVDLEVKSQARRAALEEAIVRIAGACRQAGYAKAILFGSMARGDVGPDSDIDLLLVKDTQDRFMDRLDEFYRTVAPKVAVDVLVYTPEEFRELLKSRSFIRTAVEEGVVLFDDGALEGRGE